MRRPNVLLIVLDSVRAKNTGLHGYHRNTTPFLSDYVREATVYEQARSPGIHSIASHASIWTGEHVESHGLVRHEDELKPGTTVWEALADQGYATGIFTTNPVVTRSSNLAEPFGHSVTDDSIDTTETLFPSAHSPSDVVKHEGVVGNVKRALGDDQPVKSLLNNAHHFVHQVRDDLRDSVGSTDVIDEFEDWQADQSGPWAACINLMDAHFPYEPSEQFDQWGGDRLRALHRDLDKPPANEFIGGRPWWQLEAFEHLYDGAIRELDSHVQRIVSHLEQTGAHDETLVVVTSDHGEGFGERSRLTETTRLVDHSWGIHEVLTHVPLLVRYPGQTDHRRVREPASLTEFYDTVRSAVDGDWDYDSFAPDGRVLASTIRLREEDDGIFDGSREQPTDYYGPWRAVYEGDGDAVIKHAVRGDEAISLEIENPGCVRRLDESSPELIRSCFGSLGDSTVRKAEGNEIGSEVEEKLADLGYIR